MLRAGKVALSGLRPLASGFAELEIAINARQQGARVSKNFGFLIVRDPFLNSRDGPRIRSD